MDLSTIKFQIAAITMLLIIVLNYARNKKLPLLSMRIFSFMLAFACINLIFDVATIYTITHPDTVSDQLNRICHQIFIGSLNTMLFLLFWYAAFLARGQRRIKLPFVLLYCLPYLLSLFVVAYAPLYYYRSPEVSYSYGPMATIVYVCAAIYIISANVFIIRRKESFSPRTRNALHGGTLIWAAAAVIQLFNPELLLSSLAVSLMIGYMYITFENPREHFDRDAGCFNRRAFHLMLTEAYFRKRKFFVVNVVLENISEINTKLGWESAGMLLRRVSGFLQQTFMTQVYHYRGNSLCVMANEAMAKLLYHGYPGEKSGVRMLSETVDERFRHVWVVGDTRQRLKCHIDIIECPKYCATTDELYAVMDYMFGHKYSEHDEGRIHEADSEVIDRKNRRMKIEEMIDDAIRHDGLDVVYQPIYSVSRGRFCSAEALVRLKDTKTIGFVSPDEFIPVAERKGYISELGSIVFKKVCAFAAEQKLCEKGIEYIEVNLSGVQVADPALAELLKTTMDEYNIAPNFVNFEITETAAVESGDMLTANMRSLRDLGCSFSMDDFGTGYSNLSQMAETSFDLIKIDKSLIWPCFGDAGHKPNVVLRNVVSMVLELDSHIVAEGVETKEQVDKLAELGVEYLQGYYFSRPVDQQSFLDKLTENTSGEDTSGEDTSGEDTSGGGTSGGGTSGGGTSGGGTSGEVVSTEVVS